MTIYFLKKGDTSHCHPMFGSILCDVIKHIIGLDLSDVKTKRLAFEYKSKFNIKNIDIKYKGNHILLNNNELKLKIKKGYSIIFNGHIYSKGEYFIKI